MDEEKGDLDTASRLHPSVWQEMCIQKVMGSTSSCVPLIVVITPLVFRDYWGLLEITRDYWRLLGITRGY